MREGMNGDEVQVTLMEAHGGGKVACVQLVLQRAVTTFIGRYGLAGPLGVVTPLDGRSGETSRGAGRSLRRAAWRVRG